MSVKYYQESDKQRNKSKDNEKLFGHMLLVESGRKLDMHDVMKYPGGPFSW